jgi:hypothetical protein
MYVKMLKYFNWYNLIMQNATLIHCEIPAASNCAL